MTDANAGRWWEGGVLYTVYVRSFADSDRDGYGDLPGLTGKLDYLSWLGVDGLWLSPTMPSPNDDWGYDVAGYRSVHADLGTMADLDRLIGEAGRRGIRILLDLVPNHTSAAHPWFVAASADATSLMRDYYVWADPAPGGGPPNNWLAAGGGPAWTRDAASGQYYLHNFLPSQPDLNWWNPAVAEEFAEIAEFWFARGVAGFRIDVAHGLYKDARLRDNPPAPPGTPAQAQGGGQLPRFSANRPETHQVYRRWREIAERHDPPKLLLGETWTFPVEHMLSYYGADDQLQLAFNFPFLFTEFSAPALAEVVQRTFDALPPRGCPVWAGSNHDVSRLATRWAGGDPARTRLALLILLTLPGTAVLYYGDEIGMTDVPVPPAARRDAMTKDTPGGGRDQCRTPMPWSAEPGAGFCPPGVTPWLPLGDHRHVNVAAEREDPASVLSFTRDLIALRRQHPAGVADYDPLAVTDHVWAYRAGPLTIAANLSPSPVTVPHLPGDPTLTTSHTGPSLPQLHPWQGVVLTHLGT